MEYSKYNYGFSEWHNSTRALKEHLWARNGPTYWRQPISFGPMTSPRQDHYGRLIPSDKSRYVTHSLRFKTSATYLQTLFPTKSFSFASPGTVVEASFQCTQLDKMGWLGGGGYHYAGLWIHGVQYEKKDGTKIVGSFLPVLFESLTDPITTGREELGMPKLYCDINVTGTESSSRVTCGWRGASFLTMKLDDLADMPLENGTHSANGKTSDQPTAAPSQAPKPVEQGLFVYRYIPAVGKRGVADAEYPVFIDYKKATATRVADKTVWSRKGSIEADGRDWESLPTLHHIAAGLAGVPVYEVIEAKIEEGHGVEDLSQAERIE